MYYIYGISGPSLLIESMIKDEGVGDSHVEKEVVNALLKFPTLGAAAVIASQLITVMNCTHPPVVQDHTLRAGNRDSRAILFSSQQCPHS